MRRLPLLVLPLLLACPSAPSGDDGGANDSRDSGVTVDVDAGSGVDAGQSAGLAVRSTVPSQGATGVLVVTPLVVTFDAPVSAAQLTLSPNVTVSTQLDATNTTLIGVASPGLMAGTQYTATVTATASGGATLTHTFTFTTAGVVDTTPPTLLSSVPAEGAQSVAVDAGLSLTFSEAILTESLQVGTLPELALGMPTWSGNTVSFPTAAPWLPDTGYRVFVSGTDLAGNPLAAFTVVSFRSAPPGDMAPPTVVFTAPARGATQVNTNLVPLVTFSERMDPSTASAMTITPMVPCTFALDSSGTTLSCAHAAPLASNTTYTVTVATSARDLAMNPLVADFTFTFTTGATSDTTPPTVSSATPSGATPLRSCATLNMGFSEPMNRASVQAALRLSGHDGGFSFLWSTDGGSQSVTVAATPALPSGNVMWQLGAGAQDLAGNALSPVFSRSLQVLREVTLTPKVVADDFELRRSADGGIREQTAGYQSVGDDNVGELRTFMEFDLSGLPRPIEVISAGLDIFIGSSNGNMFGVGGPGTVTAEVINATGPHASWWNAPALPLQPACGGCLCFGQSTAPTVVVASASSSSLGFKTIGLQREVAAMVNSMPINTFPSLRIRLRSANGTNNDPVSDNILIASKEVQCHLGVGGCTPKLTIRYWAP